MKQFIALPLCVLLSAIPLLHVTAQSTQHAQTVAEALTNKDVVEMVKGGLSPDIIIAKIKASPCRFDTSTEALLALKSVGATDAMIVTMLQSASEMRVEARPTMTPALTPEATTPATAQQFVPNAPEYGDISFLRTRRHAYVMVEDPDVRQRIHEELEKYPGVQVTVSPDSADFVLAYAQGSEIKGISGNLFSGTMDYKRRAQMVAYVRSGSGRPRIVWSETEQLETNSGITFSRRNEVNLTRNFIKALKRDQASANAFSPPPPKSQLNRPASERSASPVDRVIPSVPREKNRKEKLWWEMEKP